jgi:hypothetical protein
LEKSKLKWTIRFGPDQIKFTEFVNLMDFIDQFPYESFKLELAFDLVKVYEQALLKDSTMK